MCAKSSASSKRKTKARKVRERAGGLFRATEAATAREAAAIAAGYQVILETEDGHWYGRGLELPHVFGDGATPDKCVAATREAFTAAVAYLLEQGQKPPAPARTGRRTQQVNVRLTAEEKAIIEGTARRKGYSGLSDFLRAMALESTGRE
jgi:predicted RNase H-like HicB family nuclease